jgi:hypothetical protein
MLNTKHGRNGSQSADRKHLQIEHAPHLSESAKLVKLADKICNVRDVASNPPATWPLSRRLEYFEWAKQVVDGVLTPNVTLRAARSYCQIWCTRADQAAILRGA